MNMKYAEGRGWSTYRGTACEIRIFTVQPPFLIFQFPSEFLVLNKISLIDRLYLIDLIHIQFGYGSYLASYHYLS